MAVTVYVRTFDSPPPSPTLTCRYALGCLWNIIALSDEALEALSGDCDALTLVSEFIDDGGRCCEYATGILQLVASGVAVARR